MSELSPERQRKVAEIKDALGRSDRAVYGHFVSLDTFERSAKQTGSGRVSGEWLKTLAKLREELLRARERLDQLNTGLRAEALLRRSLGDAAAAVDAWESALGSSDPDEIAAAMARMENHFAAAERNGSRGASDLKRGR